MLPTEYAYLFGSLLFVIPWLAIFFTRKDLRGLLIGVGLLFIPLGLIAEYFWWTKDWWKPITITGTTIGLEDIIMGFTNGGIAACLYLLAFRKKFVTSSKTKTNNKYFQLALIIVFIITVFAILFSSGINSYIATLVTMVSASILLLMSRKDLFLQAIISGILMVVLVIPVFLIVIAVSPGVVEKTWMTENLMGIYPFGVPLEDMVFYFLAGVFCFGIYPFLKNSKLRNLQE